MQIRKLVLLALALATGASSLLSEPETETPAAEGPVLNELRAYLTPSQRVKLIRAEQMVQEGESEIVAGTHYAERAPSRLKPDEDIKAVNERGKKMILTGQERVARGEAMIEELRGKALEQREQAVADQARTYSVELRPEPLSQALGSGLRQVLEACWEKAYDSILYDGIYLTDAAGTELAPADLRNQIYDRLVEIDGTNFTVSVPIDFEFILEADGRHRFDFTNAEALADDAVALLAIELIRPDSDGPALLAVSAIDTASLQVVAQSLAAVSDPPDSPSEAAESEVRLSPIPESASLVDHRGLIESLAGLETPYLFEIHFADEEPSSAHLVERLVATQLVVGHSELAVFDRAFVTRAYLGAETASPGAEAEAARTEEARPPEDAAAPEASGDRPEVDLFTNASLVFAPAAESGDDETQFIVRALAGEQERVVDVGPLTLAYPASATVAASGQEDDRDGE